MVDSSLSPSEDKLPQQCPWRGLQVPIWTCQGGGLEWEEEEELEKDVRWRRKWVTQTPASALTESFFLSGSPLQCHPT